MATNLITKIPIFVFSSQIGTIELSTDETKIEIVVEDGLTKMFKTSLYAFDKKVSIVNIGEVLENYMIANGKVFTAFTVYYNTAEGAYIGSFNLNTLFCTHITDAEAGLFGSYNFLTTLSAKRVPRDSVDSLWLFHGQDNGMVKAHCVYEDEDGETANKTVVVRRLITEDIGVTQIVINQSQLLLLLRMGGASVKKLLSYSIEFNSRYFTYYVVDYTPEVVFTFKNCFNVDETIYLNAITTTKTKVNRSMAISGGEHRFYDQSVDKTYEVQTSSLTADEAEWVEQLFVSHSVRLGVATDSSTLRKVIITESDCEIADNDEELNKVKFTWQFADKSPHLRKPLRSDTNGKFTEPYNQVFD